MHQRKFTSGEPVFIEEDYADRLDEEGRDYLRRIIGGADKMSRLIDDMLTLSRISRQEMNRQNVDLSATVRDYLNDLKTNEPLRQVEIVIREIVHAYADPRLIHLAL